MIKLLKLRLLEILIIWPFFAILNSIHEAYLQSFVYYGGTSALRGFISYLIWYAGLDATIGFQLYIWFIPFIYVVRYLIFKLVGTNRYSRLMLSAVVFGFISYFLLILLYESGNVHIEWDIHPTTAIAFVIVWVLFFHVGWRYRKSKVQKS